MSNPIVTFDQFNRTNLKGSEPIPKQIKKPNETINYNEIKLSYNYGTPTEPIIQDLFFELPLVRSSGINTKEEEANGKNGPYIKKSQSMMIVFDLATPETKVEIEHAIAKLNEVHSAASHCIGACKGKLKMHDFDPNDPRSDFKNPIYWHRDEVTGERIKGKNPNIWVKLRNGQFNRTLFTDMNGKPIDWKLLENVNIEMVPLLHIEKIYIGSKASLQIYMASAIITKIVAAGSESRQMSTLDRLKAKYGDSLVDQVEEQLTNLRMARQDTLNSTPQPQFQPSFESENPGTMHSIPQEAPPAKEPSLQEFLGGPPPMSAPPTQTQPESAPQFSTPRLNIQTPTMKIN